MNIVVGRTDRRILGVDLRSRGYQVFWGQREQTCHKRRPWVVDDASVDLALLAAAEVVFICTPLGQSSHCRATYLSSGYGFN